MIFCFRSVPTHARVSFNSEKGIHNDNNNNNNNYNNNNNNYNNNINNDNDDNNNNNNDNDNNYINNDDNNNIYNRNNDYDNDIYYDNVVYYDYDIDDVCIVSINRTASILKWYAVTDTTPVLSSPNLPITNTFIKMYFLVKYFIGLNGQKNVWIHLIYSKIQGKAQPLIIAHSLCGNS